VSTFPNSETQFRPGQSGNPVGYSKRRRLRDALHILIDEEGLDRAIVSTALGQALGKKASGKDPGRAPNLAWFRELRDILGDTPRGGSETDDDGESEQIDPETAKRLLRAANHDDSVDAPNPSGPSSD
jgi:hypothetical protein